MFGKLVYNILVGLGVCTFAHSPKMHQLGQLDTLKTQWFVYPAMDKAVKIMYRQIDLYIVSI